MSVITDIQVQKRNKQRASIFIDGNFSCGIDMLAVVSFGLKIGSEITEEKLHLAIADSERSSAFTRSIDYLSRGRKTVKQMRDYLLAKQYSETTVKVVLEKLKQYKYLDDRQFCESYISSNQSSKGSRRIVQELITKGIAIELANEYVVEEETEQSVALRLTEKYMKNKQLDLKTKSKLYRYLISRGYDYSVVSAVVERYSEEQL